MENRHSGMAGTVLIRYQIVVNNWWAGTNDMVTVQLTDQLPPKIFGGRFYRPL
jgi:hypothetical protein